MPCEISQGLQKLLSSIICFARLVRFHIACEIQFFQFAWLARFCKVAKSLSSVCKACENSHSLLNSFSSTVLSVLQLVLLLHFCIAVRNCWVVDFFFVSPPCMLDWLGKGYKAFQSLVPSCVWALSCFAMDYTTSPSFLAHFNDRKTIKNIQNWPKID